MHTVCMKPFHVERAREVICWECYNEDGPASFPNCKKCNGYGYIEEEIPYQQQLIGLYLNNGCKKEDADAINAINGVWVIK